MKTSTATRLRLKTRIILYKKGEAIYSTTRFKKTQVLLFVQGIPAAEWDKGYVKITHNSKLDYFNHAWFEDIDKLKRILTEFTSWDLVKDFI